VGQDNIIAALEHPDRVRQIILGATPPVWESLATAMQVPFPELTSLQLWSEGDSMTVFPDSFLSGLAPRLQKLLLGGIVFPAVRKLLLSASDLVQLDLLRLPHSGYISPESMVACLSSLNRLESLKAWIPIAPNLAPTNPLDPHRHAVVLPALIRLSFRGMSDYSEDLVARIDTPVLKQLHMVFFMDLVFDVPHFKQFVGRAKGLEPFKAAKLLFELRFIRLELDRPHGSMIEVRCNRIDWQVDSMALLCG
jgi:pimeloyl-ACP methyl ester carboxylesterase